MKIIVAVLLLSMLIHIMSFSLYNLKNKNKRAAVGSAILGITAFALGIFVLFFGKYEI